MRAISFKRHRFSPEIIRLAVWLYFRFTLSIRDVEEMMAQRGIDVSRETVRCWVSKFGPTMAASLRRRKLPPSGRWRLDEVMAKIGGKRMLIWRAVDDEGEVLDVLVQKRRNKAAALKLLKRLLKNQGVHPESLITDCLASYGAATRELNLEAMQIEEIVSCSEGHKVANSRRAWANSWNGKFRAIPSLVRLWRSDPNRPEAAALEAPPALVETLAKHDKPLSPIAASLCKSRLHRRLKSKSRA